MVLWIALSIAFIVPLLFLWLLRKFDLYQTGKYVFNIITIFCGIIAYAIAAKINPAMVNAGWVTWDQVVRITAPIVEELLKALILIILVQRADFNYVVDGAIYGFGAGIGFAIIENYEYITHHPEIALILAVERVFSTNLVHATASGLIGTGLAYRRGDSSWRAWLVIVFGYLFAISIHMAFNTLASAGVYLIFVILFGLIGLGLIWYVIKRGLNIQKEWVAEKLNMTDRVTKQESKVVSHIETINEILAPVEERFGTQMASLVRSLIYKQAEMGIKRKLLDTATNETRKKDITKIIEELSRDTNELRKQIGPYCMMMIRSVYLDHDLQIWNLLNARVAAAGLGQKGGGLWDRVNERMQAPPSQDEES